VDKEPSRERNRHIHLDTNHPGLDGSFRRNPGLGVARNSEVTVEIIKDTMGWHDAVAQAKTSTFGTQDMAERLRLSIRLIREESRELIEELELIADAPECAVDVCAAAKEASDLLFVTLQAMHCLGLNYQQFSAVFAEVVRSNYSKLDGGVAQFREDGKLLKGPAYRQADVRKALKEAA